MSNRKSSEEKAERFFDRIYAAAAGAAPDNEIRYDFRIAGRTVRLIFAGPALVERVVPALRHLRCAPADADLTVRLWDSESTGQAMPPNDWAPEDYLEHGLIRGYNTDNVATAFNMGSGTLNMYRADTKTAVFWTRSAETLPYYETGAPLRNVIFWWASRFGLQYAHAAAVGTDAGAVLLVGKGGSGKSTSALSALLYSRMDYLGDDYVLIGTDPVPRVYSLYSSAKLNADHIGRFPQLLEKVSNRERLRTQKALMFLAEQYPDRIVGERVLKGVVLPRVTGRPRSACRAANASEALRALAPSSIFQLPNRSGSVFGYFGNFVRKVPAFHLDAGTDFARIPEVLTSIVEGGCRD